MNDTHDPFFRGRFEGAGRWTDITGDSKQYRISTLVFGADDGLATIEFVHDLYEENDRVEASFALEFSDDSRFVVKLPSMPDGPGLGSGHLFDNYLQYLLVIDGAVIENRMVLMGERLHVFGSSSKNKAGHFIRWEEELTRTG